MPEFDSVAPPKSFQAAVAEKAAARAIPIGLRTIADYGHTLPVGAVPRRILYHGTESILFLGIAGVTASLYGRSRCRFRLKYVLDLSWQDILVRNHSKRTFVTPFDTMDYYD